MKKCNLFLALLLTLAAPAFAQYQPERLRPQDIVQQPDLLTPDLALSLSKTGLDAQGFLPPTNMLSYNLLDSVYYYNYDAANGGWHATSKTYRTNDCETGKLLVAIDRVEGAVPDGIFENYRKEEWSYYLDGTTKDYHYYVWNTNTNAWLLGGERLYNEAGNNTLDWAYYFNSDTWLPAGGQRTVNTYNGEAHLLVRRNETYDPISGTWVPTNMRTHGYINGLLSDYLDEVYANGFWEPVERTNYTYDAEGKLTESLTEDFFQGDWRIRGRNTFTYNSAGLEVLNLRETNPLGTWLLDGKVETSYHSNNQPHIVQEYGWNDQSQTWIPYDGTVRDDQGNYLAFTWMGAYNNAAQGYYNGFRLFITLNANGYQEKLIAQQLEELSFDNWLNYDSVLYTYDANNRLEENISHRWDGVNNTYYFSTRSQYFNTGCLFNGSQETTPNGVACGFANPLVPGQAIYCPGLKDAQPYRLELYSMTGARVHAQPFQSGQTLTAQGLVPGIYLLAISDGGGVVQRAKVVVQ